MTAPLPGDSELVRRAQTGDTVAFDELFRRHAGPAWGLAQTVAADSRQAAEAVVQGFTAALLAVRQGRYLAEAPFRPKLLAATRLAAIDLIRRANAGGSPSGTTSIRPLATPTLAPATNGGVAAALASLPERWRSVLWLTEAEGLDADAASMPLGLKPGETARLASRAREGLANRIAQSDPEDPDDPFCRRSRTRLGALAAGTLSPSDSAMLEHHLNSCDGCGRRAVALGAVGAALRKAQRPLPAGLAATAAATWAAALEQSGPSRWAWSAWLGPWADKVVGGTAAAVFALGIVAAIAVGGRSKGNLPSGEVALGLPAPVEQPLVLPPVLAPPSVPVSNSTTDLSSTTPRRTSSRGPDGEDTTRLAGTTGGTTGGTTPAVTAPAPTGGTTAPPASSPPPASEPAPTAPAPDAQVDLGVNLGDQTVAVSVGTGDGSCTGVDLLGVVIGCDPPDTEGTVTLSTGDLLPPITIPSLLP